MRDNILNQFKKTILTKPIIIDYDFDGMLSAAYLRCEKDFTLNLVGIIDREYKGAPLLIKTDVDWKECAFIDFEVHGIPSIGQHLLIKWDKEILNPNKEFNIRKLTQKYPMSTLFYLIYLNNDFASFSHDQLKYLAIPDKTFENSWKYGKNFWEWMKRLKIKNLQLMKILADRSFYDKLSKDYPHIYKSYPDLIKKVENY